MSITLTEIINEARKITGFSPDRSAVALSPPDDAIIAAMGRRIRDVSAAIATAGGDAGEKEIKFTAVTGQQDYDWATYIGTDVLQITEVLRSAAYRPDYVVEGAGRFAHEGGYAGYEAVIPAGLQGDVFETMNEIQRSERADRYGWLEAPGNKIRLVPPPAFAEIIHVTYLTTGSSSVSDLDDSAKQALVYGACVEILDCVLNRLPGRPITNEAFGKFNSDQMKTAAMQRDRYELKYGTELRNLSEGV